MYQCVATNNVGSVVKNSHVEVIKRTKVSIASDEGSPEITIQAGEKLKFPCRVENDKERNRITAVNWKKDNKSISWHIWYLHIKNRMAQKNSENVFKRP